MPEKDAFADRGRGLEEEYFRKKDRELLEKMRAAAASDLTRKELGAKTGITDPDLLRQMDELGFRPDTIVLLPLVPVIQVAWAEGGVSDGERKLVLELARARGIGEGSPADRQLAAWLADPPDERVFAGATRLIRAMLDAQAPGEPGLDADDLVRYCESVASASGGFLGINRISAEERALLGRISAELKSRQA